MIRVKRTGEFDRKLQILFSKGKELQDLIEYKILLFTKRPDDARLRNHALRKRMKGKWAFSIDGNIRIVYIWQSKRVVKFLSIGTHKEVYRN